MTSQDSLIGCLRQPAIVPFYCLLFLYVLVYSPHIERPPEVVPAAVLKILPIWYLAFFVYQHKIGKWQIKQTSIKSSGLSNSSSSNGSYRISSSTSKQNGNGTSHSVSKQDDVSKRKDSFLGCFFVGLLVSSIGDVCLAYHSLFKPGIFFFGMAQLCYLLALKKLYRRARIAWMAIPIGSCLFWILFPGLDETVLKVMVFGYAVLIHSMLFFAIAGYESCKTGHSMLTMAGASLFILSDFLIAVNKWVLDTPHHEACILFTYYVAQLFLTVGAC